MLGQRQSWYWQIVEVPTHADYDSLVGLGCCNYQMSNEAEDVAANEEPTATQ